MGVHVYIHELSCLLYIALDWNYINIFPLFLLNRQNQLSMVSMDTSMSLSEFARHVLAEICGEEWVMQKCLQSPEVLCQSDMLLDSMLTPKQAQRLNKIH